MKLRGAFDTGDTIISGSLVISGSAPTELTIFGNQVITGSLVVSGAVGDDLIVFGMQRVHGTLVVSSSNNPDFTVIGDALITGSLYVSQSLTTGTIFTASLQEGYVFVGGAGNRSTTIATGSLLPTIKTVANNVTNGTTTGAEITDLNTTLGVGTYWIQIFIRYQSAATTTGVKFGVNHTGTSTLMATMRYGGTGTTASTGAATQAGAGATGLILEHSTTRSKSTTAPNLGPTISVDSLNSDMMAVIDVYLNVTVSGDFELWHGSEVAANSTVMAGTAMIINKVA